MTEDNNNIQEEKPRKLKRKASASELHRAPPEPDPVRGAREQRGQAAETTAPERL